MGVCASCDATAVVAPLATVKLVLEDGGLREFSLPVTAAHALSSGKDYSRSSFICSADDLDFGGAVTSLRPDDELQLGQIYFVLPRSMLGRPMHADDMAKLAVRANASLMGSTCKGLTPLVFAEATERSTRAVTLAAERSGCVMTATERRRRARSAGGSGRSFASELSIILEEK